MTPFWQDEHLTLYGGDCRAVLATMAPESVHCVVTSPPYWGLRDYGTATWEGGDEACDHALDADTAHRQNVARSTLGGGKAIQVAAAEGRHRCRCGAHRIDSQLGLEPTPEEYVANMVAVFREVRRVLRADGTLWLNLGDSYASHDPGGYREGEFLNPGGRPPVKGQARNRAGNYRPGGLKPKDLVGIPWRVAFALQADGWYLRSDIIWSKPNPMPESVTDRPTKAHEYLFLLSKQPRYYFDADAVREAPSEASVARIEQPNFANQTGGPKDYRNGVNPNRSMRQTLENFAANPGRNLRSVWNIATEPYPGAHFATFPRKLVEPCVKAGTSERGVCPECGAPWVRVVERVGGPPRGDHRKNGAQGGKSAHPTGTLAGSALSNVYREHGYATNETTGWRATCGHDDDPVPAVVLDPFAGSGTTLLVAQSLGRRGVGIDLSPEYLKQALVRNAQTPLGLVG